MTAEQFTALGISADLATKAAAESKKELATYVSKTQHELVVTENTNLKATNEESKRALDTLKASAGMNEELKNQIATLQATAKTAEDKYKADLKDLQVTNAIKLALAGKVHDADIVSGLVDKTKLILGDDGKVTGLDEQIKTLKEGKAFLFVDDKQQTQQKPGFSFGAPGSPSGNNGNPGEGHKPMSLKDAITAHIQSQQPKTE
jgi:hypothetical protein